MPPGVNGRHTGTVPKIKPHNDSVRDYAQSRRREQSLNTLPNNLVSEIISFCSAVITFIQ